MMNKLDWKKLLSGEQTIIKDGKALKLKTIEEIVDEKETREFKYDGKDFVLDDN